MKFILTEALGPTYNKDIADALELGYYEDGINDIIPVSWLRVNNNNKWTDEEIIETGEALGYEHHFIQVTDFDAGVIISMEYLTYPNFVLDAAYQCADNYNLPIENTIIDGMSYDEYTKKYPNLKQHKVDYIDSAVNGFIYD